MKRLLVAAAVAGPAYADAPRDTPSAIEVDRDDAPPARPELGFDGGAPLPTWALGLTASWLDRPIALTTDGAVVRPVRRRATLRLGAALPLGTSVVVDARLAASHQTGDRLRPIEPRALDRLVTHDLTLGARIRVGGGPRRAAFVRGELTLPTGDDGDLAGEASWSLAWRLIGRLALPGDAIAAASAGIRLRGAEVLIGDRLIGDELLAAAGASVPLPALRPLWCADQVRASAEVVAAIGDDVGAGRGPSPIEARLGLVVQLRRVAIAVRVGRGLTDELGAPRARAAVELVVR